MVRIYHAFDNLFLEQKDFFEEKINKKIVIAENLTVLSIMNRECLNDSYLVKQCRKSGIDLCVSEKALDIKTKDWVNTLKISFIVDALEHIKTKYVLILDGRDTCILNDLDDNFIEEFLSLGADIVFNMQICPHPSIQIESEEFLKKNNNRYINAGVCIGDKESLLSFYKECEELNKKDVYFCNDGKPSEQYIIRKAANQTKINVKCDFNEQIFSCNLRINKNKKEVLNNE